MSRMAQIGKSADDLTVTQLLADLAAARRPEVMPAHIKKEEPAAPPRPLREMLDELAAADPERLPWPDDWLRTKDSGQITACRALWQSVLLSCIRAAFEEVTDYLRLSKSRLAPVKHEKTTAELFQSTWIGTRDFHMVCALAGLDGSAVQSRLRRIASDAALIAALAGKASRNNDRVHGDD